MFQAFVCRVCTYLALVLYIYLFIYIHENLVILRKSFPELAFISAIRFRLIRLLWSMIPLALFAFPPCLIGEKFCEKC